MYRGSEALGIGFSCCFKGIRCDQDDSYKIFVIQSERKDGRLKLMYAPITQSLVLGLQSREQECGYKTFKVLPETKQDIFQFPVPPESGDVVIYAAEQKLQEVLLYFIFCPKGYLVPIFSMSNFRHCARTLQLRLVG